MSLTTTSNRVVATGDNSTVLFAFNRLLYDATHLQVYLAGILQASGYTVNGAPGTVTSVTFTVAPGTSVQIIMLRVVPLTQLSVYAVAGAFPAATTEKNLDLLMMGNQQFDEVLGRAVTLPVSSILTATNLPDPALAVNFGRALKVKGDGTGYDLFDVSATPFSSVVTTKGDIAVYGAAVDRLPVGANGSLLIGQSAEAKGLKYLTPGTNGYILQSDSAQTDKLAWIAPYQPVNPIINGNMEVWQRGTTFPAIASSGYAADRWNYNTAGAVTAVVTLNRSTTVPTVAQAGVLFNYSLEVDVTTAQTGAGATDIIYLQTKIEGYNWRHFAQRNFVVSFWVQATKTGTYSLSLNNTSPDRGWVGTYVVNVTNTWEYKTVIVTASPSAGTWNYTNGIGLRLSFVLLAGVAHFQTPDQWNNSSISASEFQAVAVDDVANFFRITGIKLELGSVATPIQFVPFEVELEQAKRYYRKSFPYATAPVQNVGNVVGAAQWIANVTNTTALILTQPFAPTMRATPTLTTYSPFNASASSYNVTDAAVDASTGSGGGLSDTLLSIAITPNAANTAGDNHAVHWAADSEL